MKSISYILFDIIQNYNISLSIMEGNDKRRINLYRNIIKNSFQNLEESEVIVDGKMLYLYNKKEVI